MGCRYEVYRKASRREVANIQRDWRACRDSLSIQQQSEAMNEVSRSLKPCRSELATINWHLRGARLGRSPTQGLLGASLL